MQSGNTLTATTPRKAKRYEFRMPPEVPGGHYCAGIWDEAFAARIGQLAAAFSHLDEALCRIFCDLMGDTHNLPLREIYRSVISPNGRVQMLRTLLETTDLNRLKSNWYDNVLADFSDLKAIRNDYLHGLWWTFEDGRLFFAKPTPDSLSLHNWREVSTAEVEKVITRIHKLTNRIITTSHDERNA